MSDRTVSELNLSWGTGMTLIDNVAYLDAEGVRILDRRVYPFEIRWETCGTVDEVAKAIRAMVTQSRGPSLAASYGMILAASEAKPLPDPYRALKDHAATLITTRPTNDSVRNAVGALLRECDPGAPATWEERIADTIRVRETARRRRAEAIGAHGADLLGEEGRILTHCWAETGVAQIVAAAVAEGKVVHAYCAETRPYLQGSRLTADALRDAGARVTVVPDTAVGFVISEGLVDLAVTGADRITADGGVVNKIGTLAIASLCDRFRVPFYAICNNVDSSTPMPSDVPVEIRDGEEALNCLGERTATSGVEGLYPGFDRTPAGLVTGLITESSVIRPDQALDFGLSKQQV